MPPTTIPPQETTSKPLIQHENKIFKEYLNSPETFTLFEEHDIDILSNLLKDESLTIPKNDRNHIKSIIKSQRLLHPEAAETTLGSQTIEVKYYKPKNSGKFVGKYSLQGIEGTIRDKIYQHDGYVNLDIVNCNFTLISEIAKLNNVNLPMIAEYLENRERINEEHLKIFGNLRAVKRVFCDLITKPIHRDDETDFLKNLTDELINVNEIFKHPDYPEFKIGKIIEIYSNYIIQTIVKFLVSNAVIKDKYYSLNGDAIYFKSLKDFDIKEIENRVLEKTNIAIKLH